MPTQDTQLKEAPRAYRKWNTTGAQLYYKSGFIDVVKLCNGFMATNTGVDIVRVNGAILYPGIPGISLGDSRTFGGNEGEIYCGNIIVSFASLVTPEIEIIQKFYTEENDK